MPNFNEQVPQKICNPFGNSCYKKVAQETKNRGATTCLTACSGLYADIEQEGEEIVAIEPEGITGFNNISSRYIAYKRRDVRNSALMDFFNNITGDEKGWPFLDGLTEVVEYKYEDDGEVYKVQEVQERFKFVDIVFKTPTFDLITKDAKTNLVNQIAMFGGTLGLFTGFSILSGIELFYFTLKMILTCATMLTNKNPVKS